MSEQYIWPLVGVFLGWLLSAIAAGWKAREADKRSIGKLLARLIRILSHVRTLRAASETFKEHVESWEEYERLRNHISDKHFLEPLVDLEKLHLAVDEISRLHPVKSIELREMLDQLSKAKSASFAVSSKVNRDVYVQLLSAHEVLLDLTAQALEKAIKQLAYNHSFVSYIKVFLKLRKSDWGRSANEDFMNKFSSETWSAIRQAQRGTEADGSAPGGPSA